MNKRGSTMRLVAIRSSAVRPAAFALVLASAIIGAAGCASTGMGAAVRSDVTARMQTKQPSFLSCYGAALQKSRKVRGMLVLSITAEAGSGQFKNIAITRDELADPIMKKCVIDEVAMLKLEKPQKTNITFAYPLRFTPTK
jgi:hypothetical protein